MAKITLHYMEGNDMEMKEYEKPSVITYNEEEILDLIGPAQTCASVPLGG